jgi:hypothetical protein
MSMRKLVPLFLTVALSMFGVASAQETKAGGSPTNHDNTGVSRFSKKAVSISGTVGEAGRTLTEDRGAKTWTVSNPERLAPHVGHHVALRAHVDAEQGEIQVTSVKASPNEYVGVRRNDIAFVK